MVSSLVFALLAADPAARFAAFMKATPTFVATVEISTGGKLAGTGIVKAARPNRLRFDFKGPNADFAVSSTEVSYLELDRLEKIYDEHPPLRGLRLYESRISAAQSLFPHYLLAQSTKALFGSQQPTVTAVAGGDELSMIVKNPMGEAELKLLIDPEGRPVRYSERSSKGDLSWRLLSFKAGESKLGSYHFEAPLGYVPFALPELPFPLAVGESAPLTGWKRAGKPVDLAEPQRGKPRLLAVLGTDCPASKAVRPSLKNLAKTMPVLIIAPGEIVDPTGSLMKLLSPPGTPMFYLVGIDGKITNLWFGFDVAKAAAWESEIRTAATGTVKD